MTIYSKKVKFRVIIQMTGGEIEHHTEEPLPKLFRFSWCASGSELRAGSGRKSSDHIHLHVRQGARRYVKMMHRFLSHADVQTIRRAIATLQIGMGAADGAGQIHPLRQNLRQRRLRACKPVAWVVGVT